MKKKLLLTSLFCCYQFFCPAQINSGNSLYFQSINLINIHNNVTGFVGYASKTIMTLTGFDTHSNPTSSSNNGLLNTESFVNLEKLLVRYDIDDAGMRHHAPFTKLTHLEDIYTSSSQAALRKENCNLHNNSLGIITSFRRLQLLLQYSLNGPLSFSKLIPGNAELLQKESKSLQAIDMNNDFIINHQSKKYNYRQ